MYGSPHGFSHRGADEREKRFSGLRLCVYNAKKLDRFDINHDVNQISLVPYLTERETRSSRHVTLSAATNHTRLREEPNLENAVPSANKQIHYV